MAAQSAMHGMLGWLPMATLCLWPRVGRWLLKRRRMGELKLNLILLIRGECAVNCYNRQNSAQSQPLLQIRFVTELQNESGANPCLD